MARSIVKRVAQLLTPQDVPDYFLQSLPKTGRDFPMPGERASAGSKVRIKTQRQGSDVIDYEAPDARMYLDAYHRSLASPAYRSLKPEKQKAFRKSAEQDLTSYKDII